MLKISVWISLILISVHFLSQRIFFNPTISEPRGYYLSYSTSSYKNGDKVLICVEGSKYINTMHHVGLPYVFTECPGQSPYLLKTIVATEGDVIEVSGVGILINGQMQHLSKSSEKFKNIELYPMKPKRFILSKGEFLVLGNTLNSYDSRYFGIINKSQMYSKAMLIWSIND